MKPKEVFLQRIENEIKMLKDAYEYNKNLPDSFFEGLQLIPSESPIIIEDPKQTIPYVEKREGPKILGKIDLGKSPNNQNESDYGRNKKLILKIIMDENKAILKGDIIRKFNSMTNSDEDNYTPVTNALAALSKDNEIKGYKPTDIKIRGNYWGISKWFDGDSLKPEYIPKVEKLSLVDQLS